MTRAAAVERILELHWTLCFMCGDELMAIDATTETACELMESCPKVIVGLYRGDQARFLAQDLETRGAA